jgi:hypothetical protein
MRRDEYSPDGAVVPVLLEEYKEMTTDIRARVELQQRNFNVFIVLLTAATGYLVDYWNRHGLGGGPDALTTNEIAVLVPIIPLVASMFTWRNSDHDANIVDKALYVDEVLRPRLAAATGDPRVLAWEKFLRHQRDHRLFTVGLLAVVGTEQLMMFVLGAAYLGAGWSLQLSADAYAGDAAGLYRVLMVAATVLIAASGATAVAASRRYTAIAARSE